MSSLSIPEQFDTPVQSWRLLLDEPVFAAQKEEELSHEVEDLCAEIDRELAAQDQVEAAFRGPVLLVLDECAPLMPAVSPRVDADLDGEAA